MSALARHAVHTILVMCVVVAVGNLRATSAQAADSLYNGTGYDVVVCNAAGAEGYPVTNQAFQQYDDGGLAGAFATSGNCPMTAFRINGGIEIAITAPGRSVGLFATFDAPLSIDWAQVTDEQSSINAAVPDAHPEWDPPYYPDPPAVSGTNWVAYPLLTPANTFGQRACYNGTQTESPAFDIFSRNAALSAMIESVGGSCSRAGTSRYRMPSGAVHTWAMQSGCLGTLTVTMRCYPVGGATGTTAHAVRMHINDPVPPSLSLTGGSMNLSGGTHPPDPDPSTPEPETLLFATSDNVGIRRLVFKIDGIERERRDMTCDHRFRAPCPEATAFSSTWRAPGAVDDTPFEFDIDPFTIGSHTASIESMDGSGRVTIRSTTFVITTPLWIEDPCVDTRDVPVDSVVVTCDGPGTPGSTDDSIDPESADSPVDPAGRVDDPTDIPGIFNYSLAVNEYPNSTPIDPSKCHVVNRVNSAAGGSGAPLTARERNQVISVTIDLNAFIRRNQLGTHRSTTSVDIASRQPRRYREALGC